MAVSFNIINIYYFIVINEINSTNPKGIHMSVKVAITFDVPSHDLVKIQDVLGFGHRIVYDMGNKKVKLRVEPIYNNPKKKDHVVAWKANDIVEVDSIKAAHVIVQNWKKLLPSPISSQACYYIDGNKVV